VHFRILGPFPELPGAVQIGRFPAGLAGKFTAALVRAPLGTLRTAKTLATRAVQILHGLILAAKNQKVAQIAKIVQKSRGRCAKKSVLPRICRIFRAFPIPNPHATLRSPKPVMPCGLAFFLLFLGLPSPPLWGPRRDPVRVLRTGDWPFCSAVRAGIRLSSDGHCQVQKLALGLRCRPVALPGAHR